ncbi:MAG: hypothetical protein CM15mP79_0600 [Methanobacteriota archaeon]|nr:MAG: hypothetical protein CM15mP79_0600 [Euryarchaeota archaeon]
MDLIEAQEHALVVALWCTIRTPASGRTGSTARPRRGRDRRRGDLNGAAIPYLRENLQHIILPKRPNSNATLVVRDGDGRAWADDDALLARADVLVNLPLARGSTTSITCSRFFPAMLWLIGWADIDRHEETTLSGATGAHVLQCRTHARHQRSCHQGLQHHANDGSLLLVVHTTGL